jgi:hypothetical protein
MFESVFNAMATAIISNLQSTFINGFVALVLYALFEPEIKQLTSSLRSHLRKNRKRYIRILLSVSAGFFIFSPIISATYCEIHAIDTTNVALLPIDYLFIPCAMVFVFCITSLWGPLKERC